MILWTMFHHGIYKTIEKYYTTQTGIKRLCEQNQRAKGRLSELGCSQFTTQRIGGELASVARLESPLDSMRGTSSTSMTPQ